MSATVDGQDVVLRVRRGDRTALSQALDEFAALSGGDARLVRDCARSGRALFSQAGAIEKPDAALVAAMKLLRAGRPGLSVRSAARIVADRTFGAGTEEAACAFERLRKKWGNGIHAQSARRHCRGEME